jgi:putative lysine/arginine/ornithine/histidine/octopine transport system permease protein
VNWELILKHLPQLLQGACLTLQLVGMAVFFGLLLAIPLGVARASRHWYICGLPYLYIFLFRGTPLLVQLFLIYYGLSQFESIRQSSWWDGWRFSHTFDWQWLGWNWTLRLRVPGLRDPFTCTVLTMTLHTTAYIGEIVRGAIQAVPAGEVEAARALGMSRSQTLRHIILPRAARLGLPAYSNEVILMLKGSALASTVTLVELTGAARTLAAKTYMQAEFLLAAGILYLVIAFVLIQLFKLLERWLRVDMHRSL